MVTHDRWSTRISARKKFQRVSVHLRDASLGLGEINKVYEYPHPKIGEACQKCIEIISMVENMVWEIRSQI